MQTSRARTTRGGRPEPRLVGARVACLLSAAALLASGCGYNSLVSEREAVEAAWSDVETQLQRRNDLVPNLVAAVKGYAAHEAEVLQRVTEARGRVVRARSSQTAMEASNDLSGALSRLLLLVERYPALRADRGFLRLQDELAGTENRLAVARKRYNEAVRAYNTTARRFPTNLVASWFGFETREYFAAPEEVQALPVARF